MQLILEHNSTKYKRYYDNVNVNIDIPLYMSVQLNIADLQDGEYTLTLYKNSNEILAKELVRIGDYQIKEYKVEKKYTQYARK